MNLTSKRFQTSLFLLLLAAATFALYYQVRSFEFVSYDDPKYVFENKNIRQGFTSDAFKWAFTSSHASNWHPLTWLSHMLDYKLFKLNPAGHHLHNVLLHIINSLLLFLLLKQMTAAVWPSAFVAAAFALHPLHIESVAWVSERKDVLSTFFFLLTIAAYLRYVRKSHLRWYLLTLLAFALGLMAKPMLVTLPFVLLLFDYWPLNRLWPLDDTASRKAKLPRTRPKINYRCIWEKIPLLALTAISCIVTFLVQRSAGVVADIHRLPVKLRIANALIAYTKYIQKLFLPTKLAVLYPYDGHSLTIGAVLTAAFVLLVISFIIIRLSKKYKYLIIGWLWYIGTLVPVIGIVQVGNQVFADRYTYIPFIGLFIIIAWAANDLLAKFHLRKIVLTALAVILIAACSLLTHHHLQYWRNSFTLFERALEVTSNNSIMYYNLGFVSQDHGQVDKAVFNYQKAIQIDPKYSEAHNNLGGVLFNQNKFKEAAYHLQQALKLKPGYAKAHNNLGTIFKEWGRLDEAMFHYNKALETEPDSKQVHNNIGIVLKTQNKLDQALEHFQRALQLDPDYPEVHNNIGLLLGTLNRTDKAFEHFNRALRLKPDYAQAHFNLANLLASNNKFEQAITHYQNAVRLDPDYSDAYNNMATALKDLGRLDEAVKYFNKAIDLNPKNIFAYVNLANTLKKQQRYDQAAEQYRRALQINPGFVEARVLFAKFLQSQQKFDEAIAQYQKAISISPDSAEIQNNLAWLLVVHPDHEKRRPAEAAGLALRSAEATQYKNPIVLNTLAAAYAQTNQLDKAIETTEKALELASSGKNKKLIEYTRAQLRKYQKQLKSLSESPQK